MKEYILLIPILVSFFITFYLMPYWIKKARNAGLVGKDMNKPTKEYVAECGGVIVVIFCTERITVYSYQNLLF